MLVALVPRQPGDRVVIKLQYSAPSVPRPRTGGRLERLFEVLVAWGIAQPTAYTWLVSNLVRASSYHFKMEAPPGWLVAEQTLVTSEPDPKGGNDKLPLPPGHPYDSLDAYGARSANVYVARADLFEAYPHLWPRLGGVDVDEPSDHERDETPKEVEIGVGVSFFPHPFGPLLPSLAIGLIAVIVGVVGIVNLDAFFYPPTQPEGIRGSGSGVAALLGAPAALALISSRVHPLSRRQLLARPLRARLLEFGSSLVSLGLASVAAFARAVPGNRLNADVLVPAAIASLVLLAVLWAATFRKLWQNRRWLKVPQRLPSTET